MPKCSTAYIRISVLLRYIYPVGRISGQKLELISGGLLALINTDIRSITNFSSLLYQHNTDHGTNITVCPGSSEPFYIVSYYIQGELKKTGISGVLADFGNFFFQTIMAANIIENFYNFEIF